MSSSDLRLARVAARCWRVHFEESYLEVEVMGPLAFRARVMRAPASGPAVPATDWLEVQEETTTGDPRVQSVLDNPDITGILERGIEDLRAARRLVKDLQALSEVFRFEGSTSGERRVR